jgi:hypothetical protein
VLRSSTGTGPTRAPSHRKRHVRSRGRSAAVIRAGRNWTAESVAPRRSWWCAAGGADDLRRDADDGGDEAGRGGIDELRGAAGRRTGESEDMRSDASAPNVFGVLRAHAYLASAIMNDYNVRIKSCTTKYERTRPCDEEIPLNPRRTRPLRARVAPRSIRARGPRSRRRCRPPRRAHPSGGCALARRRRRLRT